MEKKGLADVKAGLKKKYGKNVVGCADKIVTRDYRVSSGSINLDLCLGGSYEGGFGVSIGRIHAFWGDKSGGKTTTAHRIAGIFQGLCRNCWRPAKNIKPVPPSKEELEADPEARWSAEGECDCYAKGLMKREFEIPEKEKGEKAKEYVDRVEAHKKKFKKNSYEETVVAFIDAENAFVKKYFACFGDPRRLMLVVPGVGEDAVDLAHILASSNCIDLLILDSLAHFVPKDEIDSSSHDWQQALQARIVNKGVRKLVSGSVGVQRADRKLTQIWINQVRKSLSVKFGDPSVKPSGMGQEFAAHVEIRFRGSSSDLIAEKYGSEKEVISSMVSEKFKFDVTKNKTSATKGRKGFYEQTPNGTVVEDGYLFKLAMKFLVKEESKSKKGSKKYVMGEYSFKTQKEILEAIRENGDIANIIKQALFARFVPEL